MILTFLRSIIIVKYILKFNELIFLLLKNSKILKTCFVIFFKILIRLLTFLLRALTFRNYFNNKIFNKVYINTFKETFLRRRIFIFFIILKLFELLILKKKIYYMLNFDDFYAI